MKKDRRRLHPKSSQLEFQTAMCHVYVQMIVHHLISPNWGDTTKSKLNYDQMRYASKLVFKQFAARARLGQREGSVNVARFPPGMEMWLEIRCLSKVLFGSID
jgi:hypothetical protein